MIVVKKQTVSKAKSKSPINSNSAEAKKIIRKEINGYFNPQEYGVRSSLDAMQMDAEAACTVRERNYPDSYKGAKLVQNGNLAVYYDDQKVMLRKIYGEKVDSWSGDKVHNTYKNLIGREYAAMLSEREKAKIKKKEAQARKKAQKSDKKKNAKK